MRGVLKANQVTYALVLNAAAGLLISPISWSHHWVWAAPALLTCLSTTNPNRRRPPTSADVRGSGTADHFEGHFEEQNGVSERQPESGSARVS
jgi:hypothetical protein